MEEIGTRSCGHAWRNNDFDCLDCLNSRIRQLEAALREITEGRFRYNMGDFEACAKNVARLALGEKITADLSRMPVTTEREGG